MSSCYLKRGYNQVYFYVADITDVEVDVIINFVDDNPSHKSILERGGKSLKEDFNNKWNDLDKIDFNTVVKTVSGNLHCKNVLHITNLTVKRNNESYYDTYIQKMSVCLDKVDKENFKTVAFSVPMQGEYTSSIIWNVCYEFLPTYKKGQPKDIHCVANDTKDFSGDVKKYKLYVCDWPKYDQNGFGVGVPKETPVVAEMSRSTNSADSSDNCPICLCDFTDKKDLDKCGHSFCSDCIDHSFSSMGPYCPICQMVYGEVIGQQPPGTMSVQKNLRSLPGFLGSQTYVISYSIPSGTQRKDHPSPGKRFHGTHRLAYLPATKEGETVLKMLQKAFLQKLIFTVGTSRTTNMSDCVTWNDIHHKTNTDGGPFNFGYPDPDYLQRVTLELEAKGVDGKSVAHEKVKYHLQSD